MPFLSAALGIMLLLASGGGAEDDEQRPAPVRVLSTSASIDFPNEVVLTLEAESDVRIEEIRLHYRLGRQRVRSYGYPSFEPSKRVRADFVIRTGGSRYLPSGVDITYHYNIQDAEGNETETDDFLLEYKDPAYEWERVEYGGLTVLYHDRPARLVEEAARDVAARIEDVKSLLGMEEARPQKAVIFNSGGEARRSFPVVSDRAARDHLYAGFAYGEYDLFLLAGLSRSGMVHEMTHLLMDEAIDSPLATMPAWLNEGLAMYFEPGGGSGRDSSLLQALRRGELSPLRNMDGIPGRPRDVGLFYAQSRSVVRYLMDVYGHDRMSSMLAAINDGDGVDEAARGAYGASLEYLEGEWRRWLSGRLSALPSAGPGASSAGAGHLRL